VKKWLGLDLVDFAIHVFVTCCLAFVVSETAGPTEEDFAIASVFAVSAVVFGIRRHVALKKAVEPGVGTGEMQAERIADLEARVAELELAQDRVMQLEERMDFSERLLVQGRSPAEVPRPSHSRDG
jgi:hypothetical protein